MSEGVVVVAGRYPAGSVVVLYRCDDERALRPGGDGTTEVGRKVVDEHGNIGFDGLELGLHLVEGYIDGIYTLMRVHSGEADDPNLVAAQPPAQNVDVKQGTQEAVVSDPPPDAPDELAEGVPDGVALPQYEPTAQNTGGQADAVPPADEQPSAPDGATDPAAPAQAADAASPVDAAPEQPADAAAAPAPATDGTPPEQAPPSDEPKTSNPSSIEVTAVSGSASVTTEPAPADVPEATVVPDPTPPSADPATPDTPPTPEQEAAGQVADNTTPDAGSEAAPVAQETDGQGQPVEQPAVLPDAVPVGTPPAPAVAEPAEGNAPPPETPAPVQGEPAPAPAPEDAPPAEAAPAADEPAPETPASDAQAPSGAEQTAPSGAAEQPAADTPAPAEPSPPDQPATSG